VRVEVVTAGGTTLYDSDWKSGNIVDWNAADLPYGSFRLRIFSRDLEGRIAERQTTLEVSADRITIDPPLPEELKLTTTTHDGTAGALITTSGDLSFRFGDYLRRKDTEAMRLTAEGNLDVKGWIRPAGGILFPDASVLTSASFVDESGRTRRSRSGSEKTLHPVVEATGVGTTDQIAKWIDNVGTLGDSAITESGGNVGIGTPTPTGKLHIFGAANLDVFAGMGVDMIAGPAFNFGYGGASFGRSAGFFNVRPDGSATPPNPSLRFMTANQQRMIITNTGDIGIGTASPGGKLHLFAAPTADVFAGIGTDMSAGPSFNFGYGGATFGRGAGFFNVRPDLSAAAPNPSLRFMIANVQRMIITNAGDIGIGTSAPAEKVDINGNMRSTGFVDAGTQFNLAGDRILSAPGTTNLFVGSSAGTSWTTGVSDVFVGPGAGNSTTSGSANTFVGAGAGQLNVTGSQNSYFGLNAGVFMTGNFNAYFGQAAGYGAFGMSTGSSNAAFGHNAGLSITTGGSNAFFGQAAGQSNTTGGGNVFVGYQAGINNTSGSGSTIVGDLAGNASTGDFNTLLGYATSTPNGVTHATAIGMQASVTQNNSLVLGSINGINGAVESANVGIGTTAPIDALDVRGGDVAIGLTATPASVARTNSLFVGNDSGDAANSLRIDGASNTLYLVARAGSSSQSTSVTIRTGVAGSGLPEQDRLTVDPSGKVGIGTTSPNAPLQVATGDIYVSTPGSGIILRSPNGSLCRRLKIDDVGNFIVEFLSSCP